jgi:DNA-binding NarL/FixJ family response regulator
MNEMHLPRREVMVEPEAVTTLLRLRALGWGSKRIARELGLSRGTVKRYVEAGARAVQATATQ